MRMNMIVTATLSALVLVGCQSSSKKTAVTTAQPSKPAPTVSTTPAKPTSTAVSTTDPSTAELEKLARAAAEGKSTTPAPAKPAAPAAPATPATPAATTQPATPAAPAAVKPPTSPHDKPGFATQLVKGRLWVFKADSPEITEFVTKGELAKSVTRIGVGPEGMTVRAPDGETIDAYLKASK